jgi:hypothetical protein
MARTCGGQVLAAVVRVDAEALDPAARLVQPELAGARSPSMKPTTLPPCSATCEAPGSRRV